MNDEPSMKPLIAFLHGAGFCLLVAGCLGAIGGCTRSEPLLVMPTSMVHRENRPPADSATTRPVISGPLTLERAIALAFEHNPDVGVSAAEVEQARAGLAVAEGANWPSLHAVGGYSHYLDDQRLIPASFNGELGTFSDDILGADLVLSIPLFTGGRLSNRTKAADLLVASAQYRLGRTREELIYNVSSIYYAILGQRQVIDSLVFSLQTLEEHSTRTKALIDAQKAVNVDLLRTEVRLAIVKQRLVQEQNTLAVERRVLANMIGVGAELGDDLSPTGDLPTEVVEATLDDSIAMASTRRSDYLAAVAQTNAQAKLVDVAKSARWPQVYGRASYGGRYAIDAKTPLRTDDKDDVGMAGVFVDVPIFEGGQINARVREEQMRLLGAQERLRKLHLQLRLDVETAVLNVNSSRERVLATSKAIEQAEESFAIERLKYEQGKGAVVDVLDAQSAMLEAQTSYYRALADHQASRAQLRLARGEQQ